MEEFRMLSIKNYIIKGIFALAIVTVPVCGFAMESGDENPKELISFPQRVMTRIGDGAVYAFEQAVEHPKITVVVGAAVCGAIVWRRMFATQQDLTATKNRLKKHRNNECQRVIALKDEHDKDTADKFGTFDKRQTELATVLAGAGENVNAVTLTFAQLVTQAKVCGLNQSAAFTAIYSVLQQSEMTGNECTTQLTGMQQSGAQGTQAQTGMSEHMVVLLRIVGSAQSDMQALLQQMRQSGQDTTEIEKDLFALLEQLRQQNPELKIDLGDDVRIQMLSDDEDEDTGSFNSNNDK